MKKYTISQELINVINEIIDDYATHCNDCTVYYDPEKKCDCGFDKIMEKYNQLIKNPYNIKKSRQMWECIK
jgi:hypothetical protein